MASRHQLGLPAIGFQPKDLESTCITAVVLRARWGANSLLGRQFSMHNCHIGMNRYMYPEGLPKTVRPNEKIRMRYFLLCLLAALLPALSQATTILATDQSWEQSLDGTTWARADVQLTDPFADWLWPAIATSDERAFFRRSFILDASPTYGAFHYFFRGDGDVWLNGVRIIHDVDGSSSSGGAVISSLLHSGKNELFATIAPTAGSGFPGTFLSYSEIENAQIIPEPSAALLMAIGLTALMLFWRRSSSQIHENAYMSRPLFVGGAEPRLKLRDQVPFPGSIRPVRSAAIRAKGKLKREH